MGIQQAQSISVNEALKAMSDYRARASIQPVKQQSVGREQNTHLSLQDDQSEQPQQRVGRYVNIWA